MLAIWNFSTGYQALGLLHILAAVAAFGPVLLYPALRRAGDTATLANLHVRMTLPALTLTWVFGMGLVGMSKTEGMTEGWFKMSQTWIVLALLCWVVAMVVGFLLIRPAITDTSEAATKRFSAGVGITHVVLIVALYLMIFKPGGPAGF